MILSFSIPYHLHAKKAGTPEAAVSAHDHEIALLYFSLMAFAGGTAL